MTAEEHGLKLLGEGKKEGVGKKKKECSVDGCSNKVHARGFCATHSKKPCSVDGCSTKAIARGLCYNHGGRGRKKVCSMDGCSSPVRARGLCSRHGERKPCSVRLLHQDASTRVVRETRRMRRVPSRRLHHACRSSTGDMQRTLCSRVLLVRQVHHRCRFCTRPVRQTN